MGLFDNIKQEQNRQSVLPPERKSYLDRLVGNTVSGAKKIKDFLISNRGFSEEQLKQAKPTLKDVAVGTAKVGGEIIYAPAVLGRMALSNIPAYKRSIDTEGSRRIRERISEVLAPKTAEEARVMKAGDIVGLAPVGTLGKLSKADKIGIVQKSLEPISDVAENSLKNSQTGIKDKTLDFLRKNPEEITKGEVRLREIEDGRIVIEDGRHTLQAGIEKGRKPNFVDVTQEYTGQPSRIIRDLIDRTNAVDEVVNPTTKGAQVLGGRGLVANYGDLGNQMYTIKEPVQVYRGEGKGIGNSTLVKGKYYADSEEFAKNFGEVSKGTIPKGANVLDLDVIKSDLNQNLIPKEILIDPEVLTNFLMDRGIKWTKNTNTRGVEYVELKRSPNYVLETTAKNYDNVSDFLKEVTSVSFSRKNPDISNAVDTIMRDADRYAGSETGTDKLKAIWKKANTDKTTSSLEAEAKKYKSAEEFVKARGEPVYRASAGGFDASKIGSDGTYVTPSETIAKSFSEGGKRTIEEFYISPSAKILEWKNVPEKFKNFDGKDIQEVQSQIAKYAKDNGYDVVASEPKFEYSLGIEQQVINPKVLQTKSQLTDIWKKANESKKKLTPVDTAIAEGKIRVVSREGRDVYQTKEGDKWVNRRDEESALKALEPKPKAPIAEIPERLQERVIALEIQKEALDANPAKQLQKYMATRGEFKGEIGEATGKKARSKTAQQFDEKAMDLGYEDTETARKAFSEYRAKKADLEAEEADVKMAIKQAKLEAKALQGESKAIAELVEPEYTKLPTTPEAIQTLEETASRLQGARPLSPDLPPAAKPLSLQEIITQTPLKAKVNLVDYIRTPDRVLKKIGFDKEAKMLRDGYDKYVVELPKNIEKITKWYEKAPKGSGERLFKYLDGEDIKLSPEEMKLAGEIRTYLKDWADRLELPEDRRITNYITHIFDEELIAKEFDEDLAKLITDKVPGQVYDPFLEKRLGAKGYKQDVWQALDAYTKRATRKVNMDEALKAMQDKAGSSLEFSNLEKSQFDYIQKYISRVNMRPTEIDNLLDTTFKQVFGYGMGQRPINRITSFMRRLTYRGMLGANIASALRNLSQTANTYAVLGERDTINGVMKLFSPTNRKELEAQGIFANNFIQDRSINATRKLVEKADKGLWLLFDTAEKINRGTAYLGAKTKALRQGKSEQEAIDYAKSIVRKTQFNYDPVDAPVALSSDLVKTLLQFQTYTTKQTEFLVELAKDRDFAALARYSLGGLAFVYTVGQAFGMEPKELLPINTDTWSRFELAPSAKAPKEILKALINVPDEYGNERDVDEKIKDVTDTLWGLVPGGMQIKKTLRGAEALEEEGSYDKAGRKQFDVGGTPAKDVQALLFGKYANKEAKQYFDKETGDETLDDLSEADNEIKSTERKQLSEEYNAIKDLPKEAQKARLIELAQEDPDLAEKLIDKIAEEKLGLTQTEKKLKNQSVAVRAGYVKKQMEGLSKSEKKQLLIEYAQKGIVTESVLDEILKENGTE